MEKKRRKIEKGKVENWNLKSYKMYKMTEWAEDFFFFPRSTKLGNFLPAKSISHREKIRKNDFAPSKKFSSYTPLRGKCKFDYKKLESEITDWNRLRLAIKLPGTAPGTPATGRPDRTHLLEEWELATLNFQSYAHATT